MVRYFFAFLFPLVWCSPTQIKTIGPRIIGGTVANAGQFPFMAAIYKTSNDGGTYFCSGTLISSHWVLTSAQCVYNGNYFQVSLGSNFLKGDDPNRVTVSTIIVYHEQKFDPNTLIDDLGYLKFHIPITFTDYIQPIDYSGGGVLTSSLSVVAVGWGQTSDSVPGPSNELTYVTLSTLSNEECRLVFGNQIVDNMVCAGGNYNEGICNGDSGTPLILYGENRVPYQVGISSFISSSGCENPDPSGYTRTQPYIINIDNIQIFG